MKLGIASAIAFTSVMVIFNLFIGTFGYNDDPVLSGYDRCVAKGSEYYKYINKYPKLDDGSRTELSVKKRCNENTKAFDFY